MSQAKIRRNRRSRRFVLNPARPITTKLRRIAQEDPHAVHQHIASTIHNDRDLALFLSKFSPDRKPMVMEMLRPHLSFAPTIALPESIV